MATKKPAVEIPVKIQKDQAQKDVKGLSNDMVKNFAKVGAGLLVLNKAFGAMNAAVSAGLRLTKESIKLAMTQQENERKLMQATNMRGKFTRQQFEELQRLNSETQQATGIGDEYQLKLQAQLALMGVSNKELVRATRATIGLSEATGSDLNSSMRIVARTLAGNTASLVRYGIQAKDSNQAMEMLLQNFEIAKDKGQTLSGQIKILEANFGDLQETFGMSVAKSDRAVSAFEAINRSVLALNTFFQSDSGARAMDRWFKTLLGFAAKTIESFTQLIRLGQDMLGEGDPAVRREKERNKFYQEYEKYTHLGGAFNPELGVVVTRETLSRLAIEHAKRAVPMTLQELSEGFADELTAVAAAPYKPGGRPVKTGTASGKPGGGGAKTKEELEREKEKKKKILETQMALAKIQKGWDDRALARSEQKRELARLELDFEIRENDARFEAELTAFNKRQALKNEELARVEEFYNQLSAISLNGIGSMIAGLVHAGLSGEQSLSDVMGGLFGTMLSQFGSMLMSLGTATVIAATAAKPVPLLWGVLPPGLAAAAGFGLIAAGGTLMGVGQYVSSSGSATESELAKTTGTARQMAPASAADGGRRQQATEETSTVYNINFNGALPGSERRIAKEMKRILSGDYSPAGAY